MEIEKKKEFRKRHRKNFFRKKRKIGEKDRIFFASGNKTKEWK